MRWEAERWRKLYRRVDAAWARLPVLARGLGSELLKYAEDDGRIPVREDEETDEAVCCLMGARRAEWKAIGECVKALLADGYIVREPTAILIRNFMAAQARSTGAERQARYRKRKRDGSDDEHGDAPCDDDGNVTRDGDSDARGDGGVASHNHGSRSSLSHSSGSISADQNPEVPVTARAYASGALVVSGQAPLFAGEPVAKRRRKRAPAVEHPMPADWKPTDAHREKAAARGLDIADQAERFRNWAEGRTSLSWNGRFANWLLDAKPGRVAASGPARPNPSQPAFAPLPDGAKPWTPEDE